MYGFEFPSSLQFIQDRGNIELFGCKGLVNFNDRIKQFFDSDEIC